MSSERYNQVIDEAYENYLINFIPPTCPSNLDVQPSYYEPMTKEWFIKSIKEKGLRGDEFSKKWRLKIEERELTFEERMRVINIPEENIDYILNLSNFKEIDVESEGNIFLNYMKAPTKLITLTYNNETIESYE